MEDPDRNISGEVFHDNGNSAFKFQLITLSEQENFKKAKFCWCL